MRTALWLVVLPALASAAPHTGPTVEPKTLERPHDPVTLRTEPLTALPGCDTARSRLYAARDGRLEPIPFQFDQRGRDGELVLTADGAETDFTFDRNDELVFMAKDAGDRVARTLLPTARDGAIEIEVADRQGAARGWVYLVHFPDNPPPRSPVRYATFDPVRQEARAVSYEVRYARDRSNTLTGLRVMRPSGDPGEDLIRRFEMRISPTFSFFLTTVHLNLTEQSFAVEPDGLKNGPVRAVRRVRQSLDLGRAFPDVPNGRVYTHYYATSFRTPSRFSIPWLALKALRDFRFESVNAFGADGLSYWDGTTHEGVPLESAARATDPETDHDWWAVGNERGSCVQALMIPEQWRAWGIKRGVVLKDDGVGYSLLGMAKLQRAGAYELGSALVVLPHPYQPGDEVEALAGVREPLATTVRVLGVDGDGARSADAVSPHQGAGL